MKKSKLKKLLILVLICILSLFVLSACAYDVQIFKDVDFKTSAFKHITNGGQDGEKPYAINAITGATLTVEGPGLKSSVPLSTKELENKNEGLVRGIYKDKSGKFAYEGMDVYFLLNNMKDGDNGINLTDDAYTVIFKNANRETIASLTLEEIKKAHEDRQPVIIAYGVGSEDLKTVSPFVFSGANEGEHTAGYVDSLKNEDGCLKLVYNTTKYGENKDYKRFSNCAYIYVEKKEVPGFKHESEPYNSSTNSDYVISIGGKTIGYQLDFTVKELEALVEYNKDGSIKEGLGYKDYYSLSNKTYWCVNEYEGLDLYKLLQYVGMPSAEELGEDAEDTMVTFYASDGYTSAEKFSVENLANYDNFGYYKKNSADFDDGSYISTNADLVKTGYPVMLAYGVNGYPYTISNSDDGFVSGISNNGGPMRIIFGKTEYGHANGSNQIQYLSDIAVGPKYIYTAHGYTNKEEYEEYADRELKVLVNNVDGSALSDTVYTVKDIEGILYDEDATTAQIKAAKVKGVYGDAIYEGVNLEYVLSELIGVPGTNGTVTFSNGKDKITLEITELFGNNGLLAFAKNGSPMVPNKNSKGYVDKIKLNPIVESNKAEYVVDNVGGPLKLIVPGKELKVMENVTSITVNIEPDQYAHLSGDALKLASKSVKIYGEGVNAAKTISVSEIEGMQKMAKTVDFGNERYRGVPIYDLLVNVGLRYNASEVIIYSADGTKSTYKLSDLKAKGEEAAPLLAFGSGNVKDVIKVGKPLSETEGPLKFVSSKGQVKSVEKIEITAMELASWDHSSDVYSEFGDFEFELVVKNDKYEVKKVYKLSELEAMTDLIERTNYSVLDLGTCEGINIWGLIKSVAGNVPGVLDPVSVTGFATDNYSKDFLSIFSMDALEKGIVDATGNRKPIILCYAINGYPLVDTSDHEGYSGLVNNADGPVRFITETNQGASIKYAKKIVVTIKGSDEINLK